MKQGIIFDMDGTLWDSAEQVAASWTLALHQCGYADVVVTKEDMYRTMGRTMDKIAEMLFPFTQGKSGKTCLRPVVPWKMIYLRQHGENFIGLASDYGNFAESRLSSLYCKQLSIRLYRRHFWITFSFHL